MTAHGRLSGKVALITGGSGGIGLATATLFHEHGASIAIVDVRPEDVDLACATLEGDDDRVLGVAADLANEQDAARAVDAVMSRFGRLDVVANVAAIRVYGPITEATEESWQRILDVNLLATAFTCKFAIPAMAGNGGGNIINVSSSNAMVGRGGMAQYDATKGALLSLTRALACDHASDGIRVNAVSPGPTLTPFHVRRRMESTGQSFAEAEQALRDAGAPGTLLGRQAEPREIAHAMLFLASDESSYITGINLPVDGGLKGLRA